jgi:biotin operon repressor
MVDAREKTRNERLLSLLANGWMSMIGLCNHFDCPEASIRRSIQELRREGYYIVLDRGQARSYGLRTALIATQEDNPALLGDALDGTANIGGDDDADYQR